MPQRDGGLPGVDPDALARDDASARPLGGTVERTGIALVRRGETVVPATGASARVRDGDAARAPAVSVEVHVTVELGPSLDDVCEQAATTALRRLREAIAARAVG